jgi:hypothetical protein
METAMQEICSASMASIGRIPTPPAAKGSIVFHNFLASRRKIFRPPALSSAQETHGHSVLLPNVSSSKVVTRHVHGEQDERPR